MSAYAPFRCGTTKRQRNLRLEVLEPRAMLSHPAVAAVNVAGTQWDASFVSYLESHSLGSGGYAIPVGSSAQLQTLPWSNIDQIKITFTQSVSVKAADLSVSGVNTTAFAFANFNYDPNTYTATWNLAAPVAKDKLMLDLDANGMVPVKSLATGEVLDGTWTDCQSTFPSGTGSGGTDFEFRFNVLPGDVNASNNVSVIDPYMTHIQIGKGVGDTGYNYRCDVDGSGTVTSYDEDTVRARMGNALPNGDPVGMTDDAPTTCGIADVSVGSGTTDYVLSLTDFFDDAETAAVDLTYSIIGNSNPSLFNSLNINASKQLTLAFASGMKGDAALTVRTTDPSGIWTTASFTVRVSDAPFISNFYVISEGFDYYTLTGCVGDDDDDVEGFIVTFGGVLASYHLTATVEEDGVFAITVELPSLQGGSATAQTEDPHGVLSNLAIDWVEVV